MNIALHPSYILIVNSSKSFLFYTYQITTRRVEPVLYFLDTYGRIKELTTGNVASELLNKDTYDITDQSDGGGLKLNIIKIVYEGEGSFLTPLGSIYDSPHKARFLIEESHNGNYKTKISKVRDSAIQYVKDTHLKVTRVFEEHGATKIINSPEALELVAEYLDRLHSVSSFALTGKHGSSLWLVEGNKATLKRVPEIFFHTQSFDFIFHPNFKLANKPAIGAELEFLHGSYLKVGFSHFFILLKESIDWVNILDSSSSDLYCKLKELKEDGFNNFSIVPITEFKYISQLNQELLYLLRDNSNGLLSIIDTALIEFISANPSTEKQTISSEIFTKDSITPKKGRVDSDLRELITVAKNGDFSNLMKLGEGNTCSVYTLKHYDCRYVLKYSEDGCDIDGCYEGLFGSSLIPKRYYKNDHFVIYERIHGVPLNGTLSLDFITTRKFLKELFTLGFDYMLITDLHPDNILLTPEGELKIIDFNEAEKLIHLSEFNPLHVDDEGLVPTLREVTDFDVQSLANEVIEEVLFENGIKQ